MPLVVAHTLNVFLKASSKGRVHEPGNHSLSRCLLHTLTSAKVAGIFPCLFGFWIFIHCCFESSIDFAPLLQRQIRFFSILALSSFFSLQSLILSSKDMFWLISLPPFFTFIDFIGVGAFIDFIGEDAFIAFFGDGGAFLGLEFVAFMAFIEDGGVFTLLVFRTFMADPLAIFAKNRKSKERRSLSQVTA